MSRTRITKVEAQELALACPRCGVGEGEWCQRWEWKRQGPKWNARLTAYFPYLHRERFDLATSAGLLPLP